MNRDDRNRIEFEKLEDRVCLTASAFIAEAGILSVTGNADGRVQIVGADSGFTVSDNGNLIGEFNRANRVNRIEILMDMTRGTVNDDMVQVSLNNRSVDRVFAFLGHGENRFQVTGDAPVGEIAFVGGFETDTFIVDANTQRAVVGIMRDGNDVVDISGTMNWLHIDGGQGDDTVNIASDTVAGGISARLGNGDNIVDFQGTTEGNAGFMGGNGDDNFTIGESASVGNHLTLRLGSGDNVADVQGLVSDRVNIRAMNGVLDIDINARSIGGNVNVMAGDGEGSNVFVGGNVNGDVQIRTGQGNDIVAIDSTIGGDTSVSLGGGSNIFGQDGTIEGDLLVESQNIDDNFVVLGKVGGETNLDPGGQSDPRAAIARGLAWYRR